MSLTYESKDFISAQKRKPISPQQSLHWKLSRASLNLVKSVTIAKVARRQRLTAAETKFLNRWRKSVLNDDPSAFLLSKKFDMALKDLTDADKSSLSQLGFNLTSTFEQMSVQDLIFELSEVFNQNLIAEFEKQFTAESMHATWHINPEDLWKAELYISNKRKLLLDRMEDYQWHSAERLSQEDIDNVVKMFALGRARHARDTTWESDKQSLLDYIAEINNHDNRWELLRECRAFFTQGFRENLQKFGKEDRMLLKR